MRWGCGLNREVLLVLVLLVMVTLLDSALLLALWCMVRLVVQIRAVLARVVRRRGLRVLVVVRFWSVWARVVVARVVRRRCLRVLVWVSRSNATNDLVGRLWGRRGVVLVQGRAAMRAMGHSR